MLIQLGQWSRLGFSTRTRTGRGRERTASSPACSRPPLPAATHGHGRRLFRRSAAPDECRMSWTRKRAAWHPTTGRRPASLACHAHSSSRRSLSSAARATGEPGGILSCPGIPPLLRSAYRAAGGADPSGVSMFRTRETGWFRGRVAGTRYRAPAPSEPDKPVSGHLGSSKPEPSQPSPPALECLRRCHTVITTNYSCRINRTSIGKATHILRPRVALPSVPRRRRCPHDRSSSRPPPAASQRPALSPRTATRPGTHQ
jgi:hypothetical protein